MAVVYQQLQQMRDTWRLLKENCSMMSMIIVPVVGMSIGCVLHSVDSTCTQWRSVCQMSAVVVFTFPVWRRWGEALLSHILQWRRYGCIYMIQNCSVRAQNIVCWHHNTTFLLWRTAMLLVTKWDFMQNVHGWWVIWRINMCWWSVCIRARGIWFHF